MASARAVASKAGFSAAGTAGAVLVAAGKAALKVELAALMARAVVLQVTAILVDDSAVVVAAAGRQQEGQAVGLVAGMTAVAAHPEVVA